MRTAFAPVETAWFDGLATLARAAAESIAAPCSRGMSLAVVFIAAISLAGGLIAARGSALSDLSVISNAAIDVAMAEGHKPVALLTAGDSFTLSVETRDGALVESTFDVDRIELEKASGL